MDEAPYLAFFSHLVPSHAFLWDGEELVVLAHPTSVSMLALVAS